MADNGFLGLGWNFPVGLDHDRQVRLAPDAEEGIRQSIWMILATSPGERVMRPGFGCGINDMVFGISNAATASAVAGSVREALALWEPRIDVLDVTAAADPSRPGVLMVEISYQVRSTNSRFNLVYPFYLE
jgi:phage baseplate assembly protein W